MIIRAYGSFCHGICLPRLDLPVGPSPARDFFVQLGPQLGRPKAILVVSARWSCNGP